MAYLMGIDVATTGVKVILMNTDGVVCASAAGSYPLSTPKLGWAEQSPADWWHSTQKSIREVLSSSGIRPAEVAGIGLTGQMHGAVFMDKSDKVLFPAILWCDQRTARECEEITSIVGKERIFQITCNPVLTGFQAPKILWLRNNMPGIYEQVDKVLLPKDYIRFCLTGEYATDVSDASGTSLFDVNRREWSKEIIEKLDIPGSMLPRACESTEQTGSISREASCLTGLAENTPVVAGGGDQAAGGVGNGIVEEGLVSVTLGTSGVVFAHSEKVLADPQGRLHTFCHAVPGKWHIMGVMLSAAGSLRWLRDLLCDRGDDAPSYKELDEKAKTVLPGSEGLIFLPYLFGERCPYPDPEAKGVFFGLAAKHNQAHIIRAVMEGVAFGLSDSINIMKEIGLPLGARYRISGGGGKSDLWCSLLAGIFDNDVSRLSSEEGPCYGASIIAGAGVGMYENIPSICKKLLEEKILFKPDKKNVKIYNQVYRIYRDLYPALKKSFRDISEISFD